ncbi:hypothetical protein Ppa06_14080 [Planomonospora parontospora subsp. parontospora]|uniref:Uncharacterized protein n=2 Tax=Planomonospora parontospora TaxID=58119 RepID=A0AA37BDA3_9ACTN|nr:hypothetical protein GCM10010126_11490 [Planomonospora parontospora]GII07610.1 hypothetical protein Ppa06_14080 [Planomonospora parontospora subsp. parontospora]
MENAFDTVIRLTPRWSAIVCNVTRGAMSPPIQPDRLPFATGGRECDRRPGPAPAAVRGAGGH